MFNQFINNNNNNNNNNNIFSIDQEFQIDYDDKHNKLFLNEELFIQYLRYQCNQLCNPCGEDAESIEFFLQNIYNDKGKWKCQICDKQLIKIDGNTGRIICFKNACINHYQKYDDTSGPIRCLLCNVCQNTEQNIANNFKNYEDWQKIETKNNFKKVIKLWETSNYHSGIPMDIRPDKKFSFTQERYPQLYS